MGFCRRCGEIVHGGERCKCGGAAVVGTVAWKESLDPWTKTYVSRDKSPTRPAKPSVETSGNPALVLPERTLRPLNGFRGRYRLLLPLPPHPIQSNSTVVSPEEGILPSPNYHTTGSYLSKVYGSVLQSKESLASHSCAYCGTVFPPDGTIYPDPYGELSGPTRFLCRDCFTSNGGAKGQCPGCSRAVLALKSEGPFLEAAGNFWHKKCFVCNACGTNIGDSPMVDLLGKPSCSDCFDDCLRRDRTPKKNRNSAARLGSPSPNIGGVRTHSPRPRSREGSPALEELEQRLGIVKSPQSSPALEELEHRRGIVKSRQSSPALEELTHRLSLLAASSSTPSRSPSPRRSTATPDDSPLLNRSLRSSRSDLITEMTYGEGSRAKGPTSPRTGPSSPTPTFRSAVTQIEEMNPRPLFQTTTAGSSAPPMDFRSWTQTYNLPGPPTLSPAHANPAPLESVIPDLVSDHSDSATQSSVGPDSPPRQLDESPDGFLPTKRHAYGFGKRTTTSTFFEDNDVIIEETNSQLNTPDSTPKHKPVSSGEITTPSKKQSHSGKSPTSLPRLRSSGWLDGQAASPTLGPNSCAKCGKQLFSVHEGGKYVTVPVDADTTKIYHTACFTCSACGLEFKQNAQGQTAFVKADEGPCHIECAPQEKVIIRKAPSPLAQPLPIRRSHAISKSINSLPSTPTMGSYVSSRYSPPVSAPAMSASNSVPRFGGSSSCPRCKKSISQITFGISEGERSVQGPNGTRWHRKCLVCGGKKEPSKGLILRGRDERKQNELGCGKRLDSGAKILGDNGVLCRECWLLLPLASTSPERSPTRTTDTGSPGKIIPQLTSTTTLARQFTGLSGANVTAPLFRQLTGGGLSPTRSLSPTKQLGSVKPRPKSIIGMKTSQSIDESRGMFLVRQLTGSAK
ncbi:hypothetical protein D9757_002802 [Collybiopsis confluens]|uniref:LIM zinc-binding domain-containing protein n=1 Tax=Collybiopsis confluens TaxID=2823264 RepID=A0A8H5MDA0_9AGAR|nr:hypothetical protein D9757_002802 [Collybiopsis confluens]